MTWRFYSLFTLFLFFVASESVFAQITPAKIDSINLISYDDIVSNLQYSTKLFTQNLADSRKIKYARGEGYSLSNLALVYYLRGNYDKSTQYHFESFNVFADNKMYHELSDAYGEYGYQLKRKDIKKAVSYMQQAIAIANQNNIGEEYKSKLFDNYGVLKEMENQADSALYFYKKALEIKKKYNDVIGTPYSLNKIAVLKASQGKLSEAHHYLDLSDEYRSKEKGDFGRTENLSIHADFLKLEGKTDESIDSYLKCIARSKALNYNYMVLYCYENLTELYKQKKQYNLALDTYQKYSAYKDSIFNEETNKTIAQLEIAYDTEQKNKLITENQYALKNRNQQLTFAVLTVVFLILLSIGVYRYQQLKRKRIVKEIEYNNKIANAELEKKLVEEKLNISRELHDNIGSQLTFIISSLDNFIYLNKNNLVIQKLDIIKTFSKDALLDLRNTIWALKQEDDDLEKLIVKINEMISKLNSSLTGINIQIENNINVNKTLTSTQMLNLFRIVQEAMQNSIKHSQASEIKIGFTEASNTIELKISDNGKGFYTKSDYNGNGLINMKRRCEQSNADFKITSNEFGTIIQCTIHR